MSKNLFLHNGEKASKGCFLPSFPSFSMFLKIPLHYNTHTINMIFLKFWGGKRFEAGHEEQFQEGTASTHTRSCKTGQIKKKDNTEEVQSLTNVLLFFVVRNIKLFKIHIQGQSKKNYIYILKGDKYDTH